jgi:hypothetical protein
MEHKKIEYNNIPIALSILHMKQYTNLLKLKDRTQRRSSSESNSKSTKALNHTIANIQMSHLEAAAL